MMSSVRSILRSVLYAQDTSLALSAQLLNKFLCEDVGESGMFATFFIARVTKDGVLSYINGGHPPPILVSRNRSVKMLSANATPAGIIQKNGYVVVEQSFSADDTLFVYTDGVTEATDTKGMMFGIETLASLITHYNNSHPKVLINAVLDKISEHLNGAKPSDDITMVGLKNVFR